MLQIGKGKGILILISLVLLFFLASYIIGRTGLFKDNNLTLSSQKIAVVFIRGVLYDPEDILDEISKYKDRKDIKAIVLRIDSPGGTVVAAQEIYSEINKMRVDKIILASLGNVAASGGYYIASAAKEIIANPGTITGSIGVISEQMNLQELMKKIGFKRYVLRSGQYKDIGSSLRDMTEEEEGLLQNLMDNIHRQFIRDVARGRNKTIQEIEPLANGMIYTGEQAEENGLVDRLGNFQDALDRASELAGITGKPTVIYPAEKNNKIWNYFLKSFIDEIKSLIIWTNDQIGSTSFHPHGFLLVGRR